MAQPNKVVTRGELWGFLSALAIALIFSHALYMRRWRSRLVSQLIAYINLKTQGVK